MNKIIHTDLVIDLDRILSILQVHQLVTTHQEDLI